MDEHNLISYEYVPEPTAFLQAKQWCRRLIGVAGYDRAKTIVEGLLRQGLDISGDFVINLKKIVQDEEQEYFSGLKAKGLQNNDRTTE